MLDFKKYGDAEVPLKFFEEFSKIPHGSENTEKIADYLCTFAKERGLYYRRDKANNVVIKKPATPGYENRPTVIFQGHTDMVAEKVPGSDKDLTASGLELFIDGDFLKARDTTLGGDDGVAICYALAVLDSDDIPHPDFEAIFTSDEEIGLIGAAALDTFDINGRMLINIDSDVEGVFTSGCAGGVRSDISMPVCYEKNTRPRAYKVTVSGFKGGHSGIEIDKGRYNAIKFFGEILNCIFDINIASANAGTADNAIPRECEAVICADSDFPEKLKSRFETRRKKYESIEPDISLKIEEVLPPEKALTVDSTADLISMLVTVPTGVIAFSKSLAGLVETSLNLGILRLGEESFDISFSVRSARGEEKNKVCANLQKIAEKFNASYGERGAYPAWEYREESHLRNVMVSVYEKMYGKSPEVIIIHAGLECGLFSDKIPDIDCVSIGPDNFDIHTTEERLSLSSFARVWDYLCAVLKNI
ncbi:MAG: aminoacyl-histidine dipeptidase [Clostridia bacterium]|nr:aminoacyl-histidine dipeptidase [Clostridia bacterium]